MRHFLLVCACVSLAGCATAEDTDYALPGVDGATGDDTATSEDSTASPEDTTGPDTSPTDTKAGDTGTTDAGTADTGTTDTGVADTFFSDTKVADTFVADTFIADTKVADTFVPDTFVPDTFVPDTFVPDTFVPDTFVPDTAVTDTYGADGGGAEGGTCAVAFSYDFEASDDGFTHAPLSTVASDDPWKRGTPTSTTWGCHGGTKCFTTGLTGNYATCQTAELRTPTWDLSGCAGSSKTLRLSFWHYYVFEGTSIVWDGGLLQVSTDGKKWTDVTTSQPYDGVIDGSYFGCTPTPYVASKKGWGKTIPGGAWKQVTYDLDASLRVPGVRFRFVFGSDEATNKRGWYVDDVAMTSL